MPKISPASALYNSVMARGERVIAISHFVAARLADLRVDEERIRIIPTRRRCRGLRPRPRQR